MRRKGNKRKYIAGAHRMFDYGWHNGEACQSGEHQLHDPTNPKTLFKHRSVDGFPSFLSGNGNGNGNGSPRGHYNKSTPDSPSFKNNTTPNTYSTSMDSDSEAFAFLLENQSWRGSTNCRHIMFSNSTGLVRPPPTVKKLECTLEELCHGCVKKINITRNVITDTGEIIEEGELLTIKVKPGWQSGTRITFEGMGDERQGGAFPGDVTFLVAEKRHPLFRRDGNDLELAIEIPLVKALTGFTLSFPLLGGGRMNSRIDEIAYPGYEKIIAGQGMPDPKHQGIRGDLRVKFLVEFPTELTQEQRSDIHTILQDSSCYAAELS